MDESKVISALGNMRYEHKLGLISSFILTLASFFATGIDNILVFLFSSSLMTFFMGFSLGVVIKTDEIPLSTDGKVTKSREQVFVYQSNWPVYCKLLFFVSMLIFIGFLIRLYKVGFL